MSEIKITEQQVDQIILDLLKKHLEEVTVDEEKFLDLLKHSLSLNTMEKKRVVDAVPTLSQFQFDELTKVFTEEREKFKELAKEHPDDIKKLLKKQQTEWLMLGDLYVAELENKSKEEEAKKKEEEIKKSLGL
jgi:methyl coenzyme M reductase alpha subunit